MENHIESTKASPHAAQVRTSGEAEPECMRADQLAKFLGVNRKTVYEYATRNQIPHRRLGRRIVFSRSQVIAWLGQSSAAAKPKT